MIRRGHAKPLWHGHPWVYAQSVARSEGALDPGDLADVIDERGTFIGRALVSPESKIRARIVTREPDVELDERWFGERLRDALALRRSLDLPSAETNCYRLVNAEGDGLPGLIVDVYGSAVVLQFSARGMFRRAPLVLQALDELLRPQTIVERVSGAYARAEGLEAACRIVRGSDSTALGRELGLSYQVELVEGQKTGLFLDQRENRALVATLARGRDVLDLFCYCGGFALAAARAGATTVTAVDSSARAVEAVRRNATLNGLAIDAIEDDVSALLRSRGAQSSDLIILDPPKFAPDRRAAGAALQAYQRLYEQALRALRPGGFLCVSCCSHAIDQPSLERALAAAAGPRRSLRLVHASGAGCDHPTIPGFAEGAYLKFLVCQLS